jgi:hypothetical protein
MLLMRVILLGGGEDGDACAQRHARPKDLVFFVLADMLETCI